VGCGCGSKTRQASNFIYTKPDGKKVTYTSELQAQAAVIRNGGGSYVTVAK
jgi:hypothetical protein